MSYQHFYSRVPARISLYNRIDGFDTFAQSSALAPKFVLNELSTLYADKLAIHNPIKVRRGEIPVVYSQAPLQDGRVAQSAISYIPSDFTGERSAYLAHTLVLTESEKEMLFRDNGTDIFNPNMFITDISRFNITAVNASANSAYPEIEYRPLSAIDNRAFIEEFNPDMVKSFIYSVLLALCANDRAVFFRLPGDEAEASLNAVKFINCIASVLPYCLRERLSFVSYVSNCASYSGFKLRCVGSLVSSVDPKQGVFYDFTNGVVTGETVDYEKNKAFASFFYSFYRFSKIKDEFHKFVQNILSQYDSCSFNMNDLKEISFLFWQSSGFYIEKSVLPTDNSICSLLDIYEKYRKGLDASHRVQIYKCLNRYSDTQTAIPDGVFSRFSALYPTECTEAKAVVMNVLLRLIHLDLMRETIFYFISRNYLGESAEMRSLIISNFASVFYGGFIQPAILTFFDARFAGESATARDIILDKLLLSIRTPEIQRYTVAMLDRHYTRLNSAQKLKIMATCLEMIPMCDGLSLLLVDLVNRRLGREKGDISSLLDSKLSEMLCGSLMSGDTRLAAMFIENAGLCEDIALRYAVGMGVGSEAIVGIIAAMPAAKRAGKLLRAHKVGIRLGNDYYLAFLGRFCEMPLNMTPVTIDEMLRQDKLAAMTLPKNTLANYRKAAVYPVIRCTVFQVFNSAHTGGLELIKAYAEEHADIQNSPEYKAVLEYHRLVNNCDLGDLEGAFKIAAAFPDVKEIRADIAEYIKANAYNPEIQDPETSSAYELVMKYLLTCGFNFAEMYERYFEYYEDAHTESGGLLGGVGADLRGAANAIELVLSSASEICNASGELADAVTDKKSGLRQALSEFVSFYGPGAGSFLRKKTQELYFEIEELAEAAIEERNAGISSVSDAVNFLLRRK